MKRTCDMGNDEPDKIKYEIPSAKEHCFQVVDVFEDDKNQDIVFAKLEVVGGSEEGRSILHRLSLDIGFKGFFATRLFLKAIGEEYKGNKVDIDTDNWIGRMFYATIVHNGKYANIDEYNFDKLIVQDKSKKSAPEEVEWDADLK